jgi:hypothetical protein
MKFPVYLLILCVITLYFLQLNGLTSSELCTTYKSGKNRNIFTLGESISVPFASQLFAVYSYPVTAFIFETDLVLGSVYSKDKNSKIMLPYEFSHFFDLEHFRDYWSKHKLKVFTEKEYNSCFNYTKIKLRRIPEFLALPKAQFYGIFHHNNITKPFPRERIFQFINDYKMVAMYAFWKDVSMLKYTHHSIQPEPRIHLFSTAIINSLPKDYIAVHLRIDEKELNLEIPGYNQNDAINILNAKYIDYIKQSHCIKHSLTAEIEPPSIYLFVTYTVKINSDKRLLRTLFDLFKKNTNYKIFTHRMKIRTTQNFENEKLTFKSFSSEQLSYVDLLVSKNSQCFVQSPFPSSTSYMIKRLNALDHNIYETYENINKTSYGPYYTYREWGF